VPGVTYPPQQPVDPYSPAQQPPVDPYTPPTALYTYEDFQQQGNPAPTTPAPGTVPLGPGPQSPPPMSAAPYSQAPYSATPYSPGPYSPAPYSPAVPAPVGPYPAQYDPGYAYQAPQQVIMVSAPPTSGMAVTSLVFGILGVVLGWCMFGIPSVLAVIFGHAALPATRDGRASGRGLAITGLVLGYLFLVPMLLFTIFVGIGVVSGAVDPSATPTP